MAVEQAARADPHSSRRDFAGWPLKMTGVHFERGDLVRTEGEDR